MEDPIGFLAWFFRRIVLVAIAIMISDCQSLLVGIRIRTSALNYSVVVRKQMCHLSTSFVADYEHFN